MELRQLITFYKITELKSFQKAAENLGYAQSTITTQIQQLENELEIKLFERFGRKMELTSKGQVFLEYAIKIIELSNAAKTAVTENEVPKGILKIGVVESLCTIKLPELLKDYRINYPEVEVIIKVGTCTDLYHMLKSNIVDIIYILGEVITDKDLILSLCQEEDMAILASPLHRFKNKDFVSLEDIAGESLILTEKGCSYRSVFENMFHKGQVQPHIALEIGSIETIKNFVLNNLGITFLPTMTVLRELSLGNLIKLNLSNSNFNIKSQVLYHKNKWVTPAMRAFLDLLP